MGPGWAAGRVLYALKLRSGGFKWRTLISDWKKAVLSKKDWISSFAEILPICTKNFPTPELLFFSRNEFVAAGRKCDELVLVEDFFDDVSGSTDPIDDTFSNIAENIFKGRFQFFFDEDIQYRVPPNWFVSPFSNAMTGCNLLQYRHWSEIFDFGYGDIKYFWEFSRFAWGYPLVRAYQANHRRSYCDLFWELVEDWVGANPPNTGVRWKCGQEIAVRLFALVTGYFAFESVDSSTSTRKKLLLVLYDSQIGRIPYPGGNDGVLVILYSACSCSDYRPTIQATGAVVDRTRRIGMFGSVAGSGSKSSLNLFKVDGRNNRLKTKKGSKLNLSPIAISLFNCGMRRRGR